METLTDDDHLDINQSSMIMNLTSNNLNSFKSEPLKLTLLSAMFSLSIVSNGSSIVAIANRKKKLTRMYFFLLHLSIADILGAFSSLLPELIWTATSAPNFNGGDALCRTLKFVQMVAPYLSSYMLVMIAMDRFQAVCYPMTNRVWKPSQSNLKILAAWTIALVLCIPQALIFGEKDDSRGEKIPLTTCSPNLGHYENGGPQIYVTWFALTSFIFPLMALSFYYAKICCKIRNNLRTKQLDKERSMRSPALIDQSRLHKESESSMEISTNLTLWMKLRKWGYEKASKLSSSWEDVGEEENFRPRAHSVEHISRAKIKSVKQTVVIIVGYIFCSTPAVGLQLWAVWKEKKDNLEHSTEWFFWLVTLNSILNPWIYIILDAELQRSLAASCCPPWKGHLSGNVRIEYFTSIDDSSRMRRKKKISESSNSVTFNNTKLTSFAPPPIRNTLANIPRPRSFTLPTPDSGSICFNSGTRADPFQIMSQSKKVQQPHSDLRALYYQQRSRQKRRLPLQMSGGMLDQNSEAPMRNRTNTFQL